jgi:hypothetical protein
MRDRLVSDQVRKDEEVYSRGLFEGIIQPVILRERRQP